MTKHDAVGSPGVPGPRATAQSRLMTKPKVPLPDGRAD
jgi:hypothetical protein